MAEEGAPAMRVKFSLLLFLLILTDTYTTFAADWQPIRGTSRMFDASQIRHISTSLVRIWERHTDNLDEFIQNNNLSIQYKDYSYTLCQIQVDCMNSRFGYVSIVDFDSHDKAIPVSSVGNDDFFVKMNDSVADSISDKLIQTVCRFIDHE